MEIIQINLADRSQKNLFLRVPFHIYKDNPQWVPPLGNDAALMLDPGRHPFYQGGKAAFFLGYNDPSQPACRLAVLIQPALQRVQSRTDSVLLPVRM